MITYFKTHFTNTIEIDPDYRLNEIFTYELDEENILITTRNRPWVILTPKEYNLLVEHSIEEMPHIYRSLHDLGIIVTRSNAAEVARAYAHRYVFMFEPPALNIMVPTNRCNMRCTYCHAEVGRVPDKGLDMDEELVRKTIEFFFTIPPTMDRRKSIEIQGGEPLLRYDLAQLAMDYAMELAEKQNIHLRFSMVSNLTLMTDEIARDIQQRGITLVVSIDGPPHIHDAQRTYDGGKGSCNRVLYWIERLEQEYGLRVGMQPTCTTNHTSHEEEVIDFFAERERNFYARPVNRTGYAYSQGTYEELGMDGYQSLEFCRKAVNYILEKNKDGHIIYEGLTRSLLKNMLNLDSEYMCRRRPCGCASSQLVVSQKGTIHGCDAGRSIDMLVLGDVTVDTYEDIITSDTARALRSVSSETLPKCNTCAFSPYCAYCFVETINIGGNPLPKVPMDHQCQLYINLIPELFKKFTNPEDGEILTQWAQQ